MPRFDGTGPNGEGPRTGWGYGRCPIPAGEEQKTAESAGTEPAAVPQYGMGRVLGRGMRPRGGRGMGRGFGRRGGGRW